MKIVFVLFYLSFGEFIPSNEWQIVPENEPLPSGLHYRINLETGVKEAKLLENEENSDSTDIVPSGEVKDETPKSQKLSAEQKKSLEKINDYLNSIEKEKESMKSFEDLNVEMVVDFELMENITRQFTSSSDTLVKLACLEELEFLVHQVDNAADFVKLGGIDLMLDTVMRSNQSKLVDGASLVLAAAAQGNRAVQVHILKRNGVKILLEQLMAENVEEIKKRVLFALSATIRNFPSAQTALLKNDGIKILQGIISAELLTKNVITLFADIVSEEISAIKYEHDSEEAKQRATQYRLNSFVEKIKAAQICKDIKAGFSVKSGHHTTVEATLDLIRNLNCSAEEYSDQLFSELYDYKELCDEETNETDGDGYFCNLLEKIHNLLFSKDEL